MKADAGDMVAPDSFIIVNVLAVGDNPADLTALEMMLESMPVELIKARSGDEALNHLLDHDVALILMDVQMPNLDGFETAALLRQRERTHHVPIVFLTSAYQSDRHMKGYSLGAVDYLLKPIVPQILRAKIAVFVELHKRADLIHRQEKLLRERAEETQAASNANYRLLFENGPQPMWVYNTATLEYLAVNDASIEKYGYSREEFLRMTIKDLHIPEDQPDLFENISKIQRSVEHDGSFRHRKKDGTIIEVELATHQLPFAGRPARLVLANDITEKKKIEEQRLRTQRMESIGTLAGGIAHDLNNVLTPILMGLQLFRDNFTDEASRRLMDTMESSAKRGANIVRQVLTFARGMSGEQMAIQLTPLLTNMEKMLQQTFPKSIDVKVDIPAGIWLITGDPTQLDLVLLNLCVNARDAMPNGGKLTIGAANTVLDDHDARLKVQAKPGTYVVIEVNDTGHGIQGELLGKIFDPFFTTKKIGEGTGLGLSTVEAIVKSHSGFVNVDSEPGKGTSFKVFFPAKETPETRESTVQHTELPLGNGELILIVDDEAAVREIAQVTLESYRYRVLTAKNGADAVACYAEHQNEVKVVLLDIMMPVMDGPATVVALETMNPEVRIIAASGLIDSAKHHGMLTMTRSVRAILGKPYTAEKLLMTLHAVITRGSAS